MNPTAPAAGRNSRKPPGPRACPVPRMASRRAVHDGVGGHHDEHRQRPDQRVLLVEAPGLFDDAKPNERPGGVIAVHF